MTKNALFRSRHAYLHIYVTYNLLCVKGLKDDSIYRQNADTRRFTFLHSVKYHFYCIFMTSIWMSWMFYKLKILRRTSISMSSDNKLVLFFHIYGFWICNDLVNAVWYEFKNISFQWDSFHHNTIHTAVVKVAMWTSSKSKWYIFSFYMWLFH